MGAPIYELRCAGEFPILNGVWTLREDFATRWRAAGREVLEHNAADYLDALADIREADASTGPHGTAAWLDRVLA